MPLGVTQSLDNPDIGYKVDPTIANHPTREAGSTVIIILH